VHARIAVLKGLSPKENREVPPLNYEFVYRLKRDFPQLEIVLNGGLSSWAEIERQLEQVDGVMLGRAAYHNPWLLASAGMRREDVVRAMYEYAVAQVASGTALRHITRHMLGLYHGQPQARLWRRLLSDPARLASTDPQLLLDACDAVEAGTALAAAA
jgi:tRNA-dihydrouridine synthase A